MLKQPLTKMDSSKHIVMGIASRMTTQKKKKRGTNFRLHSPLVTAQTNCSYIRQILNFRELNQNIVLLLSYSPATPQLVIY